MEYTQEQEEFLRMLGRMHLDGYYRTSLGNIRQLKQYLQEKEQQMLEESLGQYRDIIHKLLPEKWKKLLGTCFYFSEYEKEKTSFRDLLQEKALPSPGISWWNFEERDIREAGFSNAYEIHQALDEVNENLKGLLFIGSFFTMGARTKEEALQNAKSSNRIGLTFSIPNKPYEFSSERVIEKIQETREKLSLRHFKP